MGKRKDYQNNDIPGKAMLERMRKLGFKHWSTTSQESLESHRAGVRSGYLDGWVKGQRAMKEACIEMIRGHMSDHVLMETDRMTRILRAMGEEGAGLQRQFGAREMFDKVFKLPYIEVDPRGDWNDHKPEEGKDGKKGK